MKKNLIKAVGVLSLTFGGIALTCTSVSATEVKTVKIADVKSEFSNKDLHLDILSTKEAVPEPEIFINARNKAEEKAKQDAQKEAEQKKQELIKQAKTKWEKEYPSTSDSFINAIAKDAVDVAGSFNIYPSVLIAQAAHESTFGTSGLGAAPYHNLFGIKGAYKGSSVTMRTWEEYGGQVVNIDAAFRSYPSWKESMEDYATLLRDGISGAPTFYSGTWRSNAATYQQAVQSLVGKYATDSAYAVRLNEMINKYDLSRFDNIKELDTSNIKVDPVVKKIETPKNTYIVKEGNTLQSIAVELKVSVRELVEFNKLEDVKIHINQGLKIPEAKKVDKKESKDKSIDTHKSTIVINDSKLKTGIKSS